MARLTIDLPPELEARLRTRVAGAGYADSEEYVRDLIAADTGGIEDVPSHLSPRSKDELEKLLIEGLNSGPVIEMTQADWDEKRRQLTVRHAKRDAQ